MLPKRAKSWEEVGEGSKESTEANDARYHEATHGRSDNRYAESILATEVETFDGRLGMKGSLDAERIKTAHGVIKVVGFTFSRPCQVVIDCERRTNFREHNVSLNLGEVQHQDFEQILSNTFLQLLVVRSMLVSCRLLPSSKPLCGSWGEDLQSGFAGVTLGLVWIFGTLVGYEKKRCICPNFFVRIRLHHL